MTSKNKTILALCLFTGVFGILLVIATFLDLEISNILAKNALASHQYVSNDTFGAIFEIIGSAPTTLLLAIACQIIFLNGHRFYDGWKKYTICIIFSILSIYAVYYMFSDIMGYMYRHLALSEDTSSLFTGVYIDIVLVIISICISATGILALNNLSDETLKKLVKFAIAVIIIAAIPTILINLVIKKPVGRIRYRAMNMYPDDPVYGFSAYARWYEINGQWIDKETMMALYGSTDALKSFPSGHTSSAATSYALITLIDIFDIKDKKKKALIWIIPLVWTGLTAVARIVVGAHFMSDVLFGGTITFVTMAITKEILICKNSHIKELFSKQPKAA